MIQSPIQPILQNLQAETESCMCQNPNDKRLKRLDYDATHEILSHTDTVLCYLTRILPNYVLV